METPDLLVVVPAGVVESSVVFTVTPVRASAQIPGTPTSPDGRAYQIEAVGEWEGDIDLSFKLDSGVEVGSGGIDEPTVAYLDDALGIWIPVEGSFSDGWLTVSVDHLSEWTTLSGWSYFVQDILGNRADPPQCEGPLPEWISDINVVEDINAPLLVCGQQGPGDSLQLKVVNNRGYSMTLLSSVKLYGEDAATADVGQAIAAALSQARGSRIYLPAGAEARVRIDKPAVYPSQPIEVRGVADQWSAVGDLIVTALGGTQLPVATVQAYYSCVLRLLDESGALASDDVQQMVAGTMGSLLECVEIMTGQLGGVVSAGMRRMLLAVSVSRFLGNLMETEVDASNDFAFFSLLVRARAFESQAAYAFPDEVLGVDVTTAIDCPACGVTGIVFFEHPTWGPAVLATVGRIDEPTTPGVVVVSASQGRVVWSWQFTEGGIYYLHPAGPSAQYSGNTVPGAVDVQGHIHLMYNPGRYDGTIVLRPTVDGFEDFASLPGQAAYAGRFYNAEPVDANGDGSFEIIQRYDDCFIDESGWLYCGSESFGFDGLDYVFPGVRIKVDRADLLDVAETFFSFWMEGDIGAMRALATGDMRWPISDYYASDPPPTAEMHCDIAARDDSGGYWCETSDIWYAIRLVNQEGNWVVTDIFTPADLGG